MVGVPLVIITAGILAVLLLASLIGHRLGQAARRRAAEAVQPTERTGETSGAALLALLGLLLAFSFSIAIQHGEARRAAVIEEVAAIGTAFLRADLLAEPGRTDLQIALRDYAATRQARGVILSNRSDFRAFLERTLAAQARLWPTAMAAMGDNTAPPIRALVANGITEVLDAHSRRYAAGIRLMPDVARFLILGVAASALVITGNTAGLQGRPLTWRTFVFASFLGFLIALTFDIERSYEGLVQADFTAIDAMVADLDAMLASD